MKATLKSQSGKSLRERKKRETRRRILNAAADLFASQGYSDTTIEAIAAEAEISKPTIFNYFDSKLAILRALIDVTDNEFVKYINEALEARSQTAERLRYFLRKSAEALQNKPEFTRLTLVEGLGALADKNMAEHRFKRLHEAMHALLQTGIEQGDVRNDFNITLLIQMVIGGYLYTLLNWLTETDYNLIEVMEETAAFLADAISPR